MRYSYCWRMSPSEFWRVAKPHAELDSDPVVGRYHQYIAVTGTVDYVFDNRGSPFGYHDGTTFQAYDSSKAVTVHLPLGFDAPTLGEGGTWAGRAIRWEQIGSNDTVVFLDYILDASFGRFTGASVGGLVVGAMGCLIFGLYLRRWLRERRALSAQSSE